MRTKEGLRRIRKGGTEPEDWESEVGQMYPRKTALGQSFEEEEVVADWAKRYREGKCEKTKKRHGCG